MTDRTVHCILYVDDERSNRVVFEHSFKDKFVVRCAPGATEALEILKTEPVAVLVTDQRMPGMTGNELLEQVKLLYPNVVRVVITAYSDLDPILRAVNDGLVARYIVKPWNRHEVENILTWGVEAFALGQQSSALQLRLMQTERLVTLGSIGAAVIHDINQPLSYMSTNAERLRNLLPAMPALLQLINEHPDKLTDTERQQLADMATELPDIVEDMIAGCKVMHGLTGSIRRLLRPTGDKDDQQTDPLPVIRYALSVCQEIAVRARATLTYDGPTVLPKLRTGATELTQVLINLIANGAQALTRRGLPGGKLKVIAADVEGMLRFTIEDDGPGMSPEILSRVGTPFFSTRSDGTGLGVAQCRRLVERDGGELTIRSTEGVGTTVSFGLPKSKVSL